MEVRSVEAVVKALNDAKVQYLIVGGLAVNAHGYERLTNDVDLVIGLEQDNIRRGLRALMDTGYRIKIPVTPEQFADPLLREAWRREKDMIVLPTWGATRITARRLTCLFMSLSIFQRNINWPGANS